MTKQFLVSWFLWSASLTLPLRAGSVEAMFSGGMGQEQADAFPGAAGHGWVDAWTVLHPKNYEQSFSFEVLSNQSLGEAPHSLKIDNLNPQADLKLARIVEEGAINFAENYSVRFKVRLDAKTNEIDEVRFRFLGQSVGESVHFTTAAWFIFAQNNSWYVVSRDVDEQIIWKRSPIRLVPGVTYSFKITVQPTTQSYQIMISDGAQEFEANGLTIPTQYQSVPPVELVFGSSIHNADGGKYSWALGEVKIENIK